MYVSVISCNNCHVEMIHKMISIANIIYRNSSKTACHGKEFKSESEKKNVQNQRTRMAAMSFWGACRKCHLITFLSAQ